MVEREVYGTASIDVIVDGWIDADESLLKDRIKGRISKINFFFDFQFYTKKNIHNFKTYRLLQTITTSLSTMLGC